MLNNQCWTCKQEAEMCPKCYGEFAKMETCDVCESGYVCPNGHKNWEGVFSSGYPEISDRVFAWIQDNRMGNPETLSGGDIPFERDEELDYLAFATNFVGNREAGFTDESLRTIRWLAHCRDLAVEAGGDAPRIMRMPLYADMKNR